VIVPAATERLYEILASFWVTNRREVAIICSVLPLQFLDACFQFGDACQQRLNKGVVSFHFQ